ncbi:MAG: thioredoxin family protein [Rhizobiaceae bacterium]|nr:thioredoxin family protein [Rhizobiaceae bacterium]
MKKQLFFTLGAIGIALTTTLSLTSGSQASDELQNPIGVVELFTSQGCSSCPPADKTLSKLIEEGQVLALSYHVDYWNYLGWVDTLATKESTDRQYAYAKTLQRRGVYTPQVIVNGRDHLVGSNYNGIKAKVSTFEQTERGLAVPLSISASDDEISISIGEGQGKASIVAVYFDNENTIDIKRGENRGRKITYHHSVRDIETIGMWYGDAQEIKLPMAVMEKVKDGGAAILLQSMANGGTPGAILGAASYKG